MSRGHVERGVAGGFAQLCHGFALIARAMQVRSGALIGEAASNG